MSEANLDAYLSGLYRETQTIVLARALELITEIGDAKSKAVACEAMAITNALQATADFSAGLQTEKPSVKAKAKAKPKPKAKAKRKTTSKAKARPKKSTSSPKERTVKVITPTDNGVTEPVDVSSNGSTPGGRLLAWRQRESLSQKKAAARAEVSISSWQAWESGKWIPGEEMMRRLEKVGV